MKKILYVSILILAFNTSCDSQTSKSNNSKSTSKTKRKVEQKEKIEITDDLFEKYIRNDSVKMKEIMKKVDVQSKKEVEKILLDAPLSKFLNQTQIDGFETLLKTNPTQRNSAFLSADITNEISKLEKAINNLNDKKITVPKSITDLYQNLLSKKIEVENFIKIEVENFINNKSSSPDNQN